MVLDLGRVVIDSLAGWDVGTFFSYYLMVFVCPILYAGWKVVKKTKLIKPEDADLVSPGALRKCSDTKLTEIRSGRDLSSMLMKRAYWSRIWDSGRNAK